MSYYASGALWSFGGLVLGFVTGYVVRGAVVRRATPGPVRRRDGRPGRFDRFGRPVLGLLLLVLVGYTVFQQAQSSRQLQDLAACEAAANRAFQQGLAQRATASKDLNDAQRQFLTTLGNSPARQQQADAFQAYLAALDHLDSAQQANPLIVRDCEPTP